MFLKRLKLFNVMPDAAAGAVLARLDVCDWREVSAPAFGEYCSTKSACVAFLGSGWFNPTKAGLSTRMTFLLFVFSGGVNLGGLNIELVL